MKTIITQYKTKELPPIYQHSIDNKTRKNIIPIITQLLSQKIKINRKTELPNISKCNPSSTRNFIENEHYSLPQYMDHRFQHLSMEIKGYLFQFDKPVYLNHCQKNKFWEVTVSNSEVNYRAGVLRGDQQHKIIEVNKDYGSKAVAEANATMKIAHKLQKGYISKTAKILEKKEQVPQKKKNTRKKKEIMEEETKDAVEPKPKKSKKSKSTNAQIAENNLESSKTLWKGLEKGQEIIEFYVVGNQLKITRREGDKQSNETKIFSSYSQAVDYVLKKEKSFQNEGFKPTPSSTFLEQNSQSTKQNGRTLQNPFSNSTEKLLVTMTDIAIQARSGMAIEESEYNVYTPIPRLGPPIDYCIKCLLAENYKDETDPTGWIMSQKLDGVRCLWTGSEMFSRNGNKFNFPNFFTKNWPNCQLDGQLFIGRGRFSQTLSAVKKNIPVASEWEKLKYLVFDAPGIKEPFKIRIKYLEEELIKIDNPFLKCHAHRPCRGFQDLFYELENVNKAGGEGIMLRQPEALYENKRSKNLQKVKTFHDDEAEIIGYTEGTGRCAGWIGALRVRNGKGVQFEVGSGLNDEMRKNPPQIGVKITYKYQEFNKQSGKPRFPTFLRLYKQT